MTATIVLSTVIHQSALEAQSEQSVSEDQPEEGDQNENVNGRGDHAADNGGGDRLHDVGADSGFPENWNQAGENGKYRHQFGSQALNGTLNNHLDAGFNRNPEKHDVAHPDSNSVLRNFHDSYVVLHSVTEATVLMTGGLQQEP